ncbi:MAG TPA: MBL fold metallo-hydrolase [Candidatus Micrarchaeaceae archaeon]|nr:MBL fold metallo-hydrolase [Candidatus Micrarchaeaceae archaeon]
MVTVVTLETPELGDRTYLIHDGEQGLVVDPQRDTDRIVALAASAQVKITCVAETHIHNDYVSGGWSLAQAVGARYLVAAADQVSFPRQPVGEGDRVEVGSMTLQALATPGHTQSHLSFLIDSKQGPKALFSGGSLLYGAVGRTDLVSPALAEALAHAQYRSALRLAALPPELDLYPTHGFGSFCASGSTSATEPEHNVGTQRFSNPALTEDEDDFVKALLAGYSEYPRYYAHMAAINLAGAAAPALGPPPEIDTAEVGRRIRDHDWVIDLRPRTEFGPSHLAGTVNFPIGDQLATYVGWVIPWGAPLTLLSSSRELVTRARRDLARIGIDGLAGWSSAPQAELQAAHGRSSYLVTDFLGLAEAVRSEGVQILDARRPDEWRERHIKNSINIHLPDLPSRLVELPDRPTWVHCAAGYRSAVAASLLDRAGREVVLVDDDIARLGEVGLELESGPE